MDFEIYYATGNRKKVKSLKTALGPQEEDDPEDMNKDIKIIQKELILPERRSDNVKEIAYEKALAAFDELKKPIIVHDGGFYIKSLNGFPRAYVNFALETIGIEGILKLIDGKDRSCEFRDCLIYFNPGQAKTEQGEKEIRELETELETTSRLRFIKRWRLNRRINNFDEKLTESKYFHRGLDEPKYFFSVNKGKIAQMPKGQLHQEGWSQLWDIFIPEGSDKTLSELTYKERIEARYISCQDNSVAEQFVKWFCENKKN